MNKKFSGKSPTPSNLNRTNTPLSSKKTKTNSINYSKISTTPITKLDKVLITSLPSLNTIADNHSDLSPANTSRTGNIGSHLTSPATPSAIVTDNDTRNVDKTFTHNT